MSSEDVNVKFGEEYDRENLDNTDNNEKEDLSKYTVIDGDNLDEDEPIKGQEYCIFSFMSPEGIMNCNVRAVKFRGAFGSLEEAEKYAGELEKKDKYFKIFCGESGKWLDFDPPLSRVEREKSSNPEHQKILDETSKHRMNKINELAGKHKELMALSISIVTKCEPCIEWHVQQACLTGASDKEIYETIDVAIEMGGGPAAAYSRFALNALDFHKKQT